MDMWIQKAGKGDEEAFLKILETYEKDMYRMAFVYVKRKEDALDVVQEAAYRAYRGIGRLKKEEYFKTWLMRIVINCAKDHGRKMGREDVMEAGDLEAALPKTEGGVEAVIRRLTLEEMMGSLTAEERTAVVLKYHYGYSFEEMAFILEKPLGTVKTVLYRALKKLRERMEKEE